MPDFGTAIQEGVLAAAFTVAKSAQANANITVTAIVTDTSRKREGIYKVRSDGAEFDAYSENGTYYKNESVLVQIPNNDYTGQKFILGRKASDVEDKQVFKFKLPFDNFVGLMHLDKNQEIPEKGFWANFPGQSEETIDYLNDKALIWEWSNIYYETDENGNQIKKTLKTIGNKKLGIQADWQTLLGSYQVSKGHYGLRIVVEGVSSSSAQGANTKISKEGLFTNNDMYGNPYSFYVPYTQQKVFDISDFLSISSIKIYFYQDYEFFDGDYKYIPYGDLSAETNEPIVPYNILCSNLDVFLGLGTDDIQDETGILYSYNALSYTGIEHTDSDGGKMWICDEDHELHFSWIHYESAESYEIIDNLEKLEEYREGKGRTHIYWYRYNYDTELEDNPELQVFPGQVRKFDASGNPMYDAYGDPKWEFENPIYENLYKDLQDSKRNAAYESKIERYGGYSWTFIPAATDNFSFAMTPRGYKSKERFKVVIQHDGSHTTSNELVFQNTLDIEAELANNAKNSNIILKCYKLKKVRDDDGKWLGTYEAVEDNTINSFHVYDENNAILYNDDDERFDQHEYYLQIHVRNEETDKYELLTTVVDNSATTGTIVSWACPRQLSMIKYSSSVNKTDAEYFGIGETEDIRYQNFQNATLKFKIDSVLNNRYLDNIIGATVIRNNIPTYISKELLFGRAEGLGHEYLPIIEILSPYGSPCIYYGQEFQIGCVVYKKDGTLFDTPSLLNFSWRILSGDPKLGQASEFHHYDNEGNYLPGYEIGNYIPEAVEGDIYKEKYSKYNNNVLKGILTNKYPPIVEVTVQNAADYPLVVRKGLMVYYDYDGGDWDYVRKRDFMIPNRVEFKSDGMTPIYYNDYFETAVLSTEDGATTNTYKIEYPDWKINNSKLFILEKTRVERKINTGRTNEDWSYAKYKMVPNTVRHEEDFNDFSMQWSEDLLSPNNYTYIYYGNDDQHIVAQAISFNRNLYSSSLVNSWDGTTLTWDEENGTILSTMIAAGSKDSYNRFTGVMMGDWHAKGDESLDTPGLYGYNGGAQTFGFKTDGTGFIGGSGKGRIEFDGTEALISNADRSCYINLNPVNYKLDEFNLENQSFSQNFIYCRVNKTSSNPDNFNDLSNGILGENSWAQQYFKQRNDQGELVDTPYDYFIVDPNHGVLTTGGVVARYGAIGNWMISDQGLYQRDIKQNKYMYLGFKPQGETSTYAIYAGTDFKNNGVAENPYFSVTWDGTLFARKGIIANTWTIDDHALTYIKNSDIMYIGTEEYVQINGTKWYPKGRVYAGTDDNGKPTLLAGENRVWAFSASDSYKEEGTYPINFGISLAGELYACLGQIAGWNFNRREFYSGTTIANSQIRIGADGYIYAGSPIMDEVGSIIGYPIMIDGRTGQFSVANANSSTNTTGFIYLGNFNLTAYTGSKWTVPTNFTMVDAKGAEKNTITFKGSVSIEEVDDSWSGSGSYSYENLTDEYESIKQESKITESSINGSDNFKIISRNDSLGIAINTGLNENGKKSVVLAPSGSDKEYATLGTTDNLWNIYSNIINCAALETTGVLSAKTMYIGGEKVASELWVEEKLKKIWDALNSAVGGSGSAAMSMTGGLGGALSSLVTETVGKEAVEDNGYMDLVGYNHEGDPIWRCENIAATNHAHYLTITSDSKLNMGITRSIFSDDTEVSLKHSHTITGSMSGNGVLTLTWDDTNFKDATGSSEIDLSAWLNAAKLEGWNLACDYISYTRNTVFGPAKNSYASGGKVLATYTPSSGSSGSSGSSSLRVGGTTYYEDFSAVVRNQRVDYDHFSSSGGSYSPSSFNWIGY